jgi:hypothetical protein
MQGFTAFLIYISIFVKQKGIAMKTTAEIIQSPFRRKIRNRNIGPFR